MACVWGRSWILQLNSLFQTRLSLSLRDGRDVPLTKHLKSELMEPSVTGEPLALLLGVTGQVGHLLLPVYQP